MSEPTDPVTAVANVVLLAAYVTRLLAEYANGDRTAESVAEAYNRLAVRRNETEDLFEDAARAGGYDA